MMLKFPEDKHQEGWQRNPYTRVLRVEITRAVETALGTLVAACRKTQDATVRQAFAEYQLLRRLLTELEREDVGSDDDDVE